MKKTLSVIGILLVFIFGYGVHWAFYDIQRLEGQEIIQEVSSPHDTYVVTAYLNNGGATTDYAVLCSVKCRGQDQEKNIYWQYHCQDADILWVDDDTVQINGIALDVERDTYDYRHN